MNHHSPPLLHTVEPMDAQVPVRWRASVACRLDARGIAWDGVNIAFDRIRTVAYSSRQHSVNLVQSRVSRRIVLEAPDARIDIHLGHQPFGPRFDDVHRAVYDAVVAAVHEAAEPRLRAEGLRRIAAGEPLHIGPLTLTHAGLGHRHHHSVRPVSWERLPVALLEGTQVVVRATVSRDGDQPWTLDMMTPNAVLLPELLVEATRAFA